MTIIDEYPVPWLATHGDAVWIASMGLIVAGGVALSWLALRRDARHDAAIARAELGELSAELVEGSTVTLTGRLAGSGTVLRTSDGDVRLAGELEILVGTHEIHRGEVVRRALADGARVRARGVLSVDVASDETGYRTARPRRALSDVRIAAEDAPRVGRPSGARALAGAAIGFAAFVAAFGMGGAALMRGVQRTVYAPEGSLQALCFDDPPTTRALIGAATPFHRGAALHELARFAHRGCQGTETEARLLVGYELARNDCGTATHALLDRHQNGRALELARACGDTYHQAVALERLGEVGEAATLMERGRVRGRGAERVLLAASRPRPVAEELSVSMAQEGSTHAVTQTCIAAALEHRAGRAGAIDDLRALVDRKRTTCALLLADSLPTAERRSMLEPIAGVADANDSAPEAACLMLLEVDPTHACGSALAMSTKLAADAHAFGAWGRRRGGTPWGLWGALLSDGAPPAPPTVRAFAHMKMADLDLASGLADEARAHLDAALEAAKESPRSVGEAARTMSSTLDILTRGSVHDGAGPFFATNESAFAAARSGDGARLVDLERRLTFPDLGALQLAAPRLIGGHARLAEWLEWSVTSAYDDDHLDTLLRELGTRGRLLRMLGSTHADELLRGALELRAVLLRRDSAVVFYALDEL